MALTPQSIRSNIIIKLNGEYVRKEEIINISKDWNDRQINFFKKILQQGGKLSILGNHFDIRIQDTILTSRGEKDGGITQSPGLDDRF
jgi:acetylglutamate synthase